MKKLLLTLFCLVGAAGLITAQTVIYDNGPVMNLPGGGAGGADVSHIHDGMNLYGSNHSLSLGYRVADEFVVPAGETWTIDSLVFFAYQTNSPITSSLTEINVRIWDGVPEDVGSTVVFGDDVTNLMITSEWSGIYRTADFGSPNCDPATCTARPIMRSATIIGTTLTAGTYWVDWQTGGSLSSGPWIPQLNFGIGVTTTGNALQYVPSTLLWQAMEDTVPASMGYEPQGVPFMVVGSITVGVQELNANNNVSVYPNPVTDKTFVNVNVAASKNAVFTFTLFDMLGNQVKQISQVGKRLMEFNRGDMPNGIYFYEVKKDNQTLKLGKIVLQ